MTLLFDAANTLIHKPKFFQKFEMVLNELGYDVPLSDIRKNHKLLSECYTFPDRTSKEFYIKFNSDLLFSLGIIPNESIHERIYIECANQPWELFEDVALLHEIDAEKVVVSNFHGGLSDLLQSLSLNVFSKVFASENFTFRKPDKRFYKEVTDSLGVPLNDLIYIGDSLKLDIAPAEELGIKSYLIDRDNQYPSFKNRIESFDELQKLIGNG